MSAAGPLEPVRTGRYREVAVVLAGVVGLAVAGVHWAGLVVGGVLLGLVAPSLRRALATAVSFASLVLVAFTAFLAVGGTLPSASAWPTGAAETVVAVCAAVALSALAALAARTVT